MDCETFRQISDADPNCPEAAYRTHAAWCKRCARRIEQARRLDARLRRALRVAVPEPDEVGRGGERRSRAAS